MVIYVHETGSDRTELAETLIKEGVTYQECAAQKPKELGTAAWGMMEISANLPEVIPVPPEYTQGDTEVRAFRLPSGRLIISDLEGNLERIATAPPSYQR